MMQIKFVTGHSKNRGIGVYTDHLRQALLSTNQLEFTATKPQLVHYPFFDLFYPTLPLFHTAPVVVTIHDLTPLVLTHLYPQGIKAKINLFRQKLSLSRVSAILTDSRSSKQDIATILRLDPQKIFVTPLGVDQKYYSPVPKSRLLQIAKKYRLPKKFVLTVAGGPNPNKNLPFLAQVTQKLNLPLVIVGKGVAQPVPLPPVHPELLDLQKLSVFPHLIRPGFVPDEDMAALYRLATVYVQASLYEGFGLPLLEAMACGTPVVSADTSSLPEIYPEGTFTFDPTSTELAATAINRVLSMSAHARDKYVGLLTNHSHQFTWENTARLTLAAYNHALKM